MHNQVDPGAVAQVGKDRRAVVLRVRGDRAVIAPIERLCDERFRGDVRLDWSQLGIAGGIDMVARCGQSRVVTRNDLRIVGQVEPDFLTRLQNAADRAASSVTAEAGPPMRMAMTDRFGTRGRKIGGVC